MKINIEVDFQDFYDDFENFDEFIKEVFKSEVLKEVKKSAEFKMAVLQHTRAVALDYLKKYVKEVK